MEALFVIPTMVSPNVNTRLVPALAKMIERNILLTNAALFRSAVLRKYTLLRTVKSESSLYELTDEEKRRLLGDDDDEWEELGDKNLDGTPHIREPRKKHYGPKRPASPYEQDQRDFDREQKEKGRSGKEKSRDEFEKLKMAKDVYDRLAQAQIGSRETYPNKHDVVEPEKIELPHGITFFHTISLEPTYLSIPVSMKTGIFGGTSERTFMVGVKAVPYAVDGVDDIINMMKYIKSLSMIERYFFSKWNSVKSSIPFTAARSIYKGEKIGTVKDIIFSPSSEQLTHSRFLRHAMTSRGSSSWTTMAVLSIFDFKEDDLKDTIRSYRKLVGGGWGDIIIVNEPKETVFFCTTKMNACYEMPFTYLKNILNLTNVMDYSEVSRWTKPFNISSMGRALSDNTIPTLKSDEVEGMILKIIS